MTLPKQLLKKFEEFELKSSKFISIEHEIYNGPEIVVPFLISNFSSHEVFVFSFGESPMNLIYLSKRCGLTISKLPNVRLFDCLSLLSNLVDDHYPIINQKPSTYFEQTSSKLNCESSKQICENLIDYIFSKIKTSKNPIVIFNGIHFVGKLFESDSNTFTKYFFTFLHKIFEFATEKTIITFEKHFLKKYPQIKNFVIFQIDFEIKLKDLKQGSSPDYLGNVTFRNKISQKSKDSKKELKIVNSNGSLEFVEQIKIA